MSKTSPEKYSKITNAFMVKGANFLKYKHDIPECPCTVTKAPNALIAYDDIKKGVRCDAFAHFYVDDYKFESIWRYPQRALKKLSRCAGVITPDFSTYQDDPEPIKLYNTYRMRTFGRWLGNLGFRVINNVRWGTKETWDYCFEGIPKNTIVSIGAVGCIKEKSNWRRFAEGLEEMIRRLNPKIILVYGSAQDKFFGKYREAGISIVEYPSRTHVAFEKRVRHE